jgi:hypothetical protein
LSYLGAIIYAGPEILLIQTAVMVLPRARALLRLMRGGRLYRVVAQPQLPLVAAAQTAIATAGGALPRLGWSSILPPFSKSGWPAIGGADQGMIVSSQVRAGSFIFIPDQQLHSCTFIAFILIIFIGSVCKKACASRTHCMRC